MSRRRKSAASINKSKDDPEVEWTEEEKSSLTDALKRDDGQNNWRWIARQVKTKTMIQVKEFASKLNSVKNAVNKRSATRGQQANSASGKRPLAPKDDGPLEGWINATKRLRGDDDIDGTCIPQIMTIAAMEPTQSDPGSQTPDYGQIYTLLSRVMREQPPPNITPLDARVILDLLNDLERRLAGHDISSQVNFVVNKYREIMATTQTEATSTTGRVLSPPSTQTEAASSTGRVLPPRQAKTTQSGSPDPNSRPKTQLFSLNPLNVPVELLSLKKRTPVNLSSELPRPAGAKETQTASQQSTTQ